MQTSEVFVTNLTLRDTGNPLTLLLLRAFRAQATSLAKLCFRLVCHVLTQIARYSPKGMKLPSTFPVVFAIASTKCECADEEVSLLKQILDMDAAGDNTACHMS